MLLKTIIGESFTYLIIFVTVWVVTFFMALPIGVQQEMEPKEGHDPGAPSNPNMKKKAIYSALVAAVLAAVIFLFFEVF